VLLEKLKAVFLRDLEAADWMDAATREEALAKAREMRMNLGGPRSYKMFKYRVSSGDTLTVLAIAERAACVSICTFVLVQLVLLTVLDVQVPSVLWCYSVYLLYWYKSSNTDRNKYKY
jgi:hypothetical protein